MNKEMKITLLKQKVREYLLKFNSEDGVNDSLKGKWKRLGKISTLQKHKKRGC